jgi:hypothetical protein
VSITLLYASTTLERDSGGHKAASAVYRVSDATSGAQALAQFYANPTLMQHPEDSTIPFDRVSAGPSPTGAEYRIVVSFSTFKGGQLAAAAPVDAPGWYSWERGRRRVDSEIANNVRVWRIPGDDETEKFEVWTLVRVKTPEVRAQRILKVRITTATQSVFDVIDDAIGDIHLMPDGRYWQLVNSETRAVDNTSWDVSYTWEYDKGTRYPRPVAGSNWQIAGYDVTEIPIPYNAEVYWRPPYCEIAVPVIPDDPRTTPFDVVFTLTGELNPDGWRALPGTEVL